MMEEKQHSDNSFLAGLVLGGIIGAALAFVFGKEEGEEVKKTLAKKGKLLLRNLGELVEEDVSDKEDQDADLKQHWGEDKEETSPSVAKKLARKFFHRNGKRLG